ncbi:MAG: hypothetical protein E7286_02590 [Lachnospiraceae bacterium]|nr:hypothetical protein [Lachnospiraceae bacterium]
MYEYLDTCEAIITSRTKEAAYVDILAPIKTSGICFDSLNLREGSIIQGTVIWVPEVEDVGRRTVIKFDSSVGALM